MMTPMRELSGETGDRAFTFPNDGGEFSAEFTDDRGTGVRRA